MVDREEELQALRAEIDAIDDEIHDLVMRRSALVERVGKAKADTRIFLRPGREALILKRLARRHGGAFPFRVVIRMWREMISGNLMMQGPFKVSVHAPERDRQLWTVARDHFGGTSPMVAVGQAIQAVRAVSDGSATVGVVPWPESDESDPWWRALISEDPQTPRIVARLPFTDPTAQDDRIALAIGLMPHERTGEDHTFIAMELTEHFSRSYMRDILIDLDLEPVGYWTVPVPVSQPSLHLFQVDDFIEAGDPRLDRLTERLGDSALRILPIGGFATPIDLR